jgi:hypothetical protein
MMNHKNVNLNSHSSASLVIGFPPLWAQFVHSSDRVYLKLTVWAGFLQALWFALSILISPRARYSLSFGADTVDTLVVVVPSELSFTHTPGFFLFPQLIWDPVPAFIRIKLKRTMNNIMSGIQSQ